MLKRITITTAAALFAISGLAVAAGSSKSSSAKGSTTAQPSFSAVDKNHDGKVSRSEWDSYFKSSSSSAGGTSSKSSGMSSNKASSGSTSSSPSKKY